MKRLLIFSIFLISSLNSSVAQSVTFEGYTYESGNRGFLNMVQVIIKENGSDEVIEKLFSDVDGLVTASLPIGKEYTLELVKDMFETKSFDLDLTEKEDGDKAFLKMEMNRAPGYVFEITMAEKRESEDVVVDAIKGARVEVYNNTTRKEIIHLKEYPHPDFKVNMLKGNHYTILIRKEGFLTKRMEAFVDVEGCILCFEGIGSVTPGVTDNLTEANAMGVLLANVELERIYDGKTMQINNLYYDLGKGGADHNKTLSINRAKAAVRYLVGNGRIDESRLAYKGYGETLVVNHCKEGVKCSEQEHALNRRTELKITGTWESDKPFKSLLQMKQAEYMDELIYELANQEQVMVGAVI